ncbi:hypothetical protein RB195_024833 [Necator americanus]
MSSFAADDIMRRTVDQCKQMRISSRPQTGIKADRDPIQFYRQRSKTASLPIRNSADHDIRIGYLGSTNYGDERA